MSDVYIVGGLRTPIGKSNGMFKNILPEVLAAGVLNGITEKYDIFPGVIEQVVLGNAVGTGGNISRVSLLQAGWPCAIPGISVDVQCGSGLAAVMLAASQIASRQADLIVAGGVESVSLSPRRQFNKNDPRFQGEDIFYERAPFSTPVSGDPEMVEGAENVAELTGITRQEMDDYALMSHQRAQRTQNRNTLKEIIVPLTVNDRYICKDEGVRPDLTPRLLKRLSPVTKNCKSITAGNACLKHDGAAAVLLASEAALEKYRLRPTAKIAGSSIAGIDPNIFPLGPVVSTKKLLERFGLSIDDIDAVEINEAFAVKVLACCRELKLSIDKTNILGGALAFGHPYGASGAIILLHLIEALNIVNGNMGIAAIGIAGGQGISMLIERCLR